MKWLIFGPEIYLLAVAIVFLILSMIRRNSRLDFPAALCLAGLGVATTLATVRCEGVFLYGAYRVDLFSQIFKGLLSIGFFLVVCLCSNLNGIREKWRPETWTVYGPKARKTLRFASFAHKQSPRSAIHLTRTDRRIGTDH